MRHTIKFVAEKFFDRPDVRDLLDRLELAVRARRGTQSQISMRTLIAGLVLAMIIHGRPQVTIAADLIDGMTKHQRKLLGITRVPTRSQLRRRLQRLETVLHDQAAGDLVELQRLMQQFCDEIVPASAVIGDGPITLAVDTTLFDAFTPKYSKEALAIIADPKRRHELATSTRRGLRRIANLPQSTLRRHVDPDATWRTIERFSGDEHTLGYGAIAVVEVGGEYEQCLRIAVQTANGYDVPVAANLVKGILKEGHAIDHVLADRGFSADTGHWLNELRSLGVRMAFDLKSPQQGYIGKVNGLLRIDGWLFLPSLPKKYWHLKRPKVTASAEDKALYNRLVDERAAYAMKVKQHLPSDPTGALRVQLYSPVIGGSAAKGPGVRCASCPESMKNKNPELRLCRAGCKPGQGCATKTIIWGADDAPDSYQMELFGTSKWRAAYGPRSGVERWFSRLMGVNVVDFERGLRVRGLVKVTLMTALAAVATNLHNRYARAYDAGWRATDDE